MPDDSCDHSAKVRIISLNQAEWSLNDLSKHVNNLKNSNTALIPSPKSSKSSLSPSKSLTRTKKVSKKKDPLRIKKPLNSFFLYRKRMREQIIADHNVTAHQQISKIAANLWASESLEVKQQYQQESLAEFEKHRKEYPDYQWPHRGSKNANLRFNPGLSQSTTSNSNNILKPTPRRPDLVLTNDPNHIVTSAGTILIPRETSNPICAHLKPKEQCLVCFKLPQDVCLHGGRGDCVVCKYREVCRHYCDPVPCEECFGTGMTSEFKLAPMLVKVL
jgi:hypothetical protein